MCKGSPKEDQWKLSIWRIGPLLVWPCWKLETGVLFSLPFGAPAAPQTRAPLAARPLVASCKWSKMD